VLGRTKVRGVGVQGLETGIEVVDRAVTYRDFRVRRKEGTAAGTFAYDFGKREVRVENIRSNVDPLEMAVWVDPKIVKDLKPYRIRGMPRLVIDGKVALEGRPGTRVVVDVEAPKGLDYTFLKKDLPFGPATARLVFTNDRLRIESMRGRLFGGEASGGADLSLRQPDLGYSARLVLDGVDFASVTKLYFGYGDSQGKLDAAYEWKGWGQEAARMKGAGRMLVRDGDVFAIPFFGPLSKLLTEVVPGFGYQKAREGRATYAVAGGAITTRDLAIVGHEFELLGEGEIRFMEDRMAMDVRVNARGVAGRLLAPVSRLFEYRGEGRLAKPEWSLKRMPGR
jgi:hypothetical protein